MPDNPSDQALSCLGYNDIRTFLPEVEDAKKRLAGLKRQ